jgi:Pentapeptide repeats (8 copies)
MYPKESKMTALDDCEMLSHDEETERVEEALRTLMGSGVSLANFRLTDFNFTGTDLAGTQLTAARLTGTDLTRADLTGTVLRCTNLKWAELEAIREDLWAVLSLALQEVPAIRAALVEGRVDGGTYYGECACLIGTIANARGCDVYSLESLGPAPSRPIEHFFLRIDRRDTPQTNPIAKLIVHWIDEWRARTSA